MAFCPKCGTPVNEKDLFCRNCGVALEIYEEESNRIHAKRQKVTENHTLELGDESKDMAFVTISVGKEDIFENDVENKSDIHDAYTKEQHSGILRRESMDDGRPIVQLDLSEDLVGEPLSSNPFSIENNTKWHHFPVKMRIAASVLLIVVMGTIFLKMNPEFLSKTFSNQQETSNSSNSLDLPIVE